MKRVLSLALVVIVVAAAVWGYLYAQSRGNVSCIRAMPSSICAA